MTESLFRSVQGSGISLRKIHDEDDDEDDVFAVGGLEIAAPATCVR